MYSYPVLLILIISKLIRVNIKTENICNLKDLFLIKIKSGIKENIIKRKIRKKSTEAMLPSRAIKITGTAIIHKGRFIFSP